MKPLFLYLFIINAADFLLMLADKQKAIKKQYRIPEAVLLSTALAGGSLGCLCGMYVAHHKTRKPLFSIGIPIILIIQALAVFCLYQ
ncbi:MAG: DUF1294 domain-containing protein [Oscillospiraceae bacterium]|nr:DUF1294 domain-containing protein [Oscillospiraceae bacterium]